MEAPTTQVRAFTSRYNNRLSNVLANNVEIGPAFDPSNQTPPTCTEFTAIWDTGATGTVVTSKVVSACGLKPISRAEVHTAAGKHTTPVYFVSVVLPNHVVFPQLRVTEGSLADNVDVLIGMDIIGQGDFATTNWNGETVFTYRAPSVECIDFVKQQPQTIINEDGKPLQKVGRNVPCPCGSGKKYKRCHGQ